MPLKQLQDQNLFVVHFHFAIFVFILFINLMSIQCVECIFISQNIAEHLKIMRPKYIKLCSNVTLSIAAKRP